MLVQVDAVNRDLPATSAHSDSGTESPRNDLMSKADAYHGLSCVKDLSYVVDQGDYPLVLPEGAMLCSYTPVSKTVLRLRF
jgi:hypothetical protein